MSDKRLIKVFLASPGDLAIERRAFKDQIDLLNLGFGDGAAVEFVPLGWEDTLSAVGRRPQAVINAEIDECHVFILAMNRRWGQDAPDSEYDSYTEEEFHRALDRWKKDRSPEIFAFFKHVDAASMADPGPQLEKVLKFRRELERSRIVLYRFFEDEDAFKGEVDKHLRAYAKGELPKADAEPEKIVLPIEYVQRIERAEAKAKQQAERAEKAQHLAEAQTARAEELALAAARQAAQAALDGHVEEARQTFAKATDATTNLEILYLAFDFHKRTGDLAQAEEMLDRWLATSGRDSESADTAAAYGNLGLIYKTRGDLDRAEEMHRKSLEISEKLGRLEGMATRYGNLGLIYRRRGDLDRAEEMHRKSLEIEEKLGHLEGMASDYGNLGLIYQMHGDLDLAEEMLRKSLEIAEKLGHLEGMATDYGNLGVIYRKRGDLEQAEEMHRKSLEISGKLGRLEGMASQYANLGSVREARDDLSGAREYWTKARDLFVKIGMRPEVEKTQRLLDELDAAGGDA